jgi:hypothetical protein
MYMLMDRGMTIAVVTHHYSVNKLMICFTERNEDMIKYNIRVSAPLSVNFSCVSNPDSFLKKMKKGLCVWLEDADEGIHGTTHGV